MNALETIERVVDFDFRYVPYDFPQLLNIFFTRDNHFETEPKPKPKRIRPNRVTPKQIRLNVAERRAASRVSMSRLRRQKLEEFDYEAYQAAFAKRCVSTNVLS